MAICWERTVPWLSAPVVFILCCLNRMCSVPVRTTGVWGRLWNSIVAVPDHYHFIYVSFKLSIRQSITQNDWQFDKQKLMQTGEKKFTLTFMGWASNLHLWFSAWMFATRGWTWFDPRRMHILSFCIYCKSTVHAYVLTFIYWKQRKKVSHDLKNIFFF